MKLALIPNRPTHLLILQPWKRLRGSQGKFACAISKCLRIMCVSSSHQGGSYLRCASPQQAFRVGSASPQAVAGLGCASRDSRATHPSHSNHHVLCCSVNPAPAKRCDHQSTHGALEHAASSTQPHHRCHTSMAARCGCLGSQTCIDLAVHQPHN